MGWKDKYTFEAKPKVTKSSGPKSFETIVEDSFSVQKLLLNKNTPSADLPRGTKMNKETGEYPVRPSWFDEKHKLLSPKISIHPLWEKGIKCNTQDEALEIVVSLSQHWNTDPDLKNDFSRVKKEYEEGQKKRLESINKGK